jgi:hypothetical protein
VKAVTYEPKIALLEQSNTIALAFKRLISELKPISFAVDLVADISINVCQESSHALEALNPSEKRPLLNINTASVNQFWDSSST